MQVFVDQQAYQPSGGLDQTIDQLVTEVGAAVPGSPRMVVSLTCDGQVVGEADIEATLARPVHDFQKLELDTQPLVALVRNILIETIDIFHQADQAREKAANLLIEGRTEEAMQQLQSFFGLWRQVQEAMVVCARAIGADLDSMDLGGKSPAGVFETIRKLLNDLKDAMVNHDYVVVGDILQYEFADSLKDWLALLTSLRSKAEG